MHNSVVRDSEGVLINFKWRFCAKAKVRQEYFKLHGHRQHYLQLNIKKPPKNYKCTFEHYEFSVYTKVNWVQTSPKNAKKWKAHINWIKTSRLQRSKYKRHQLQSSYRISVLCKNKSSLQTINKQIRVRATNSIRHPSSGQHSSTFGEKLLGNF